MVFLLRRKKGKNDDEHQDENRIGPDEETTSIAEIKRPDSEIHPTRNVPNACVPSTVVCRR
jgi:hypothetical protein